MLNLEPKLLWQSFEEICQVPRPSKKEEKIIAFLMDWGKKHGIETVRDHIGNVLMRKPATKGYEKRPTVVLQAHMDMVCEKNSDVKHDFLKDPIQPYIDGEWLKARGTTLGADNGIGMAAMMAVMLDENVKHPPLECLFTVDEETGLTGAFELKKGFLKGERLLNLDSEDDGEVFIGCAGGVDTLIKLPYKEEAAPKELYYCKVTLKGLVGGHSGDDIEKGRGNANKLMNRFLWSVHKKRNIRIAEINGGNLRNAIPRESYCVFGVPQTFRDNVVAMLNKYQSDIQAEYAATEPNLQMTIETVKTPKTVISKNATKKLLYSIYACPNGVIRMSDDMPGLVETSTNLASVKMNDGKNIDIVTSQRSSVESAKKDIASMVESVFVLAGCKVTHTDGYPGWKPNPKSEVAQIIGAAYKRLFGKSAKVKAIHAGLECGLFSQKYPKMDMASFGPTMRGVHSPDERLHIKDTEKFYQLLVEVLASM